MAPSIAGVFWQAARLICECRGELAYRHTLKYLVRRTARMCVNVVFLLTLSRRIFEFASRSITLAPGFASLAASMPENASE